MSVFHLYQGEFQLRVILTPCYLSYTFSHFCFCVFAYPDLVLPVLDECNLFFLHFLFGLSLENVRDALKKRSGRIFLEHRLTLAQNI